MDATLTNRLPPPSFRKEKEKGKRERKFLPAYAALKNKNKNSRKIEKCKPLWPLQSLPYPLATALLPSLSTPNPHPPVLSCPELSPFPSLLRRAGHMEPILLVTLKSRPCARLPPWRPGAPAPLCAPRQSRLPSPGNLAISQSPDSSSVPGWPSGWGSPASPERGALSEAPSHPKAPRPRRPNKAGGGGGVRAALPGLSPRWPAALGCLGLNNHRDAAGQAPATAEGPGPGR